MFEVINGDGTAVVAITGKLVHDNCASFSSVIEGVLAGSPATVVLDLAGTTVLDTFGVEAVLECRERASMLGTALQLRDPRELIRRLLELTADDRAAATFVMTASARMCSPMGGGDLRLTDSDQPKEEFTDEGHATARIHRQGP